MLITLADLTVEITDPSKTVADYVKGYLADDLSAGDAAFSVAGNDILELHRGIAEKIPLFDRLVCHGAVIEAEGQGIMFTAPSGTGKTTHVKLWQKYCEGPVRVINGDKPVLRLNRGADGKDRVTAFGTPWMGKERMGENSRTKLSAMVLLERGTENHTEPADPAVYLERLMQQVYLPKEHAAAEKTYELIERLFGSVPFYVARCTMDRGAYEAVRDAVTCRSGR